MMYPIFGINGNFSKQVDLARSTLGVMQTI
jgi:hypothetical protein